MSNGELGPQADPLAELTFDGPSLKAVLASELGAIQDAQGDLKGAQLHMAEEVQAARRAVDEAKLRLIGRRNDAGAKLGDLKLVGRKISIEEGRSSGEVRYLPPWGDEYVRPASKDLAGVNGIISRTEIGIDANVDANGAAGELLLHVDVPGRIIPPRAFRRYIVSVDEAVFSVGEAPEHADH